MGTLRTIGSISRDRHISSGLTGRRFTQHRQKPARGEGVRVGPWPNSDSFPLQLAILPWYSDGLVLKSKFLSVVVKFYNGRGTAEQWIKEGKNAVKWTKLSCRTFKDNQTRLQLFALAYNLANFLRRLALPRDVKHWSLTTLREKLVKIGAKVTRHAKYVTFQFAEVAVTRRLFSAILDRIERLALPPPVVARCGE